MRDEFLLSRVPRPGSKNIIDTTGRWRWWYESIADWMLRNPDKGMDDCARDLKKHKSTITTITGSDMFKDYLAQRRAKWIETHDQVLRDKLYGVAEKSLDALLSQLEKKGDQIPMPVATKMAESALDRLGFAPQPPTAAPSVVNNDNRTVVLQGVTPAALEEAREALRRMERGREIANETLALPAALDEDDQSKEIDSASSTLDK